MAKVVSEISKIEGWLGKQKLSPDEAKKILQTVRNQKSREYATHRHDFSGKHIRIGVLGDI